MKQLCVTGQEAMFGDNDINFVLQPEKFGVEMGVLKEAEIKHVFWAWVEDCEENTWKKNGCVAEAQLLTIYKGLIFHDLDSGKLFSIWEQNMEFRQERENGWFLVGVCADDEDNNEAFLLEIACELIGETQQRDGIQVKVVHLNDVE